MSLIETVLEKVSKDKTAQVNAMYWRLNYVSVENYIVGEGQMVYIIHSKDGISLLVIEDEKSGNIDSMVIPTHFWYKRYLKQRNTQVEE